MHESTKSASVEDHVRHLRRYKGELVRDLAYGTVRLPAAWLAPGLGRQGQVMIFASPAWLSGE